MGIIVPWICDLLAKQIPIFHPFIEICKRVVANNILQTLSEGWFISENQLFFQPSFFCLRQRYMKKTLLPILLHGIHILGNQVGVKRTGIAKTEHFRACRRRICGGYYLPGIYRQLYHREVTTLQTLPTHAFQARKIWLFSSLKNNFIEALRCQGY